MGKTCINCNAPAEHMHHVVPKSLGGGEGRNLVPLCCDCHGLVHGKNFANWRYLQKMGIEKAKNLPNKYLGRKPSYNQEQLDKVLSMLSQNRRVTCISRETKLSRQAVLRIRSNPDYAKESLLRWSNNGQT